MKEADVKAVVEVAKRLPADAGATGRKTEKKSTERGISLGDKWATEPVDVEKVLGRAKKPAKAPEKKAKSRAKARSGSEKLTPAAIYRKMIAFGKNYQVEKEQDFIEAARIYSEEAGLIDQMRDRLAEDGLTVLKTYKTGDVEVAHPLLSELPRHVESANKCLSTIGSMISERGARVEEC